MPRPFRGQFVQFVVRGQQLATLYLCTKFEKRSCNRLRIIEMLRNFEIGSRPLRGQFAICEQELPAVCQYAKFEERSLSAAKNGTFFF